MLRRLPEPDEVPGPVVRRGGRELVCFSSNNYLGLATHPEVVEAACRAARECGVGATGSRLLSGNLREHELLEAELAAFKGAEAALLVGSGYSANLAILTALAGPGDLLVCDKLNHASLIDGARASGAEVRHFRHGDLGRAYELLSRPCRGRRFLVSDAVFSMDGDVADLPGLLALARAHGATLVLDEAHSTGVLGAQGRGIFEHFGLEPDAREHGLPGLIRMGTLGKALGTYGAFIACDARARELLVNCARPFIFSTALPPMVAAAARKALGVLRGEPGLLSRLRANASRLREGLLRLGFPARPDPTPIVPVILGEPRRALDAAEQLLRAGVLAPAIRPPTVPPGSSRLRLSVTATHEPAHLDRALAALAAIGAPGDAEPRLEANLPGKRP